MGRPVTARARVRLGGDSDTLNAHCDESTLSGIDPLRVIQWQSLKRSKAHSGWWLRVLYVSLSRRSLPRDTNGLITTSNI